METAVSSENTLGRHIIAEFSECSSEVLKDLELIGQALAEAASIAGATVLNSAFYRFGNGGVSGVVIIAESHLSVHTWPEVGYAACDFYTCGKKTEPEKACAYLKEVFHSHHSEVLVIERGLQGEGKQYTYKADLNGL
ncbi:MAG: adenosylmethionine decarboxylase [Candidatus Bruticola sp.]